MNSLNRYMVALVFLIAFVMGGALVTSVRQVQATPEAAPQVIDANVSTSGGREEILRSYSSLTLDHIDAAIAYAAELAHEESLLPLRTA